MLQKRWKNLWCKECTDLEFQCMHQKSFCGRRARELISLHRSSSCIKRKWRKEEEGRSRREGKREGEEGNGGRLVNALGRLRGKRQVWLTLQSKKCVIHGCLSAFLAPQIQPACWHCAPYKFTNYYYYRPRIGELLTMGRYRNPASFFGPTRIDWNDAKCCSPDSMDSCSISGVGDGPPEREGKDEGGEGREGWVRKGRDSPFFKQIAANGEDVNLSQTEQPNLLYQLIIIIIADLL